MSRFRVFIFLPRLFFSDENSQKCLEVLRAKKVINSNDTPFFVSFLEDNKINNIVVVTTLKDSQTYDILNAAKHLAIRVTLIVDSWDNIGCAATIPDFSGELALWSNQQLDEVRTYYPNLVEQSRVLGSPRRLVSELVEDERRANKNYLHVSSERKPFTILFIQAYFFDDTPNKLQSIEKILQEISSSCQQDFEIIIRGYPLKAPSHNFQEGLDEFLQTGSSHRIRFSKSEKVELREDLVLSDLVISEISTGGLEALLAKIPTIFLFSNHNYQYMNGKRILDFKFARDLLGNVPIFDSNDTHGLKEALSAHINPKKVEDEIQIQQYTAPKQEFVDYLASRFSEESFWDILKC